MSYLATVTKHLHLKHNLETFLLPVNFILIDVIYSQKTVHSEINIFREVLEVQLWIYFIFKATICCSKLLRYDAISRQLLT